MLVVDSYEHSWATFGQVVRGQQGETNVTEFSHGLLFTQGAHLEAYAFASLINKDVSAKYSNHNCSHISSIL